ncbi:catalase A [Coemansia sp. RSA 1813]|nr:catalase A [Coemansia sp. RSA 1843]KAJ2212929.1 catalase A [Coemansia sp. RSA 487]KAJ2567604.1 catalase A [Coemansia sp. RSA 1813]
MIPPPKNTKQDPNTMTSTRVPHNADMGVMTTGAGIPVTDNQTSQTAGYYGPVLIQDFHLIDKLAHFDRERIPERVVHAKGAGAHGYFEVTKDISHLTCAKFLSEVSKRTPLFARFSTVGGESGSADTARDPRGFSVKFYTEEGNWDMVGNNTPIFFIRDPSKFPDFIHTQKRDPRTHLKNPDMQWDFWSHVPESLHQVMILFSNRGTPNGFRHMHGYSSHTLKLVKEDGSFHYVKWHFRTNQGIKNFKAGEAAALEGTNPDYATQDLFEAIERGDHPSWTVYIQVFTEEEAMKMKYNPFDVTKVVSQKEYPLHEVGRMVLDRNPENYFAEVEQAAFSPSHMVPGIAPSPDRMLQGRLFSYPDTHRHRLGANYLQLPINRPINKVLNHQRDGPMCTTDNGGRLPNYEPNTFGGPHDDHKALDVVPVKVNGSEGHHTYKLADLDFDQPRALYNLLSPEERQNLVENIAASIGAAQIRIQHNVVPHLKRIDPDYGSRVEAILKENNPEY